MGDVLNTVTPHLISDHFDSQLHIAIYRNEHSDNRDYFLRGYKQRRKNYLRAILFKYSRTSSQMLRFVCQRERERERLAGLVKILSNLEQFLYL